MIKIKNIYYMLAYAYQTLNESGFSSVANEEFDHIHDLMAAILIKGVTHQVKRGLHKDYQNQVETLSHLRGKIDLSESIKQQTIMKRQMVCRYDEFVADTFFNQILKTTLWYLRQYGELKVENKKAIRQLLFHFEMVTVIQPKSIKWGFLKFHRNNASYKVLTYICRLVLQGLLISTEEGKNRMANYIDDQSIHRLYEKFVLGYYQKEHPQLHPRPAYVKWNIDNGIMDFLPAMKTDISLTKGEKTLIIDTKFYSDSMQTNRQYNTITHRSSNLYQLYTYVKNADSERSGDISGVLLYAKTDEELTPNHNYVMGGNRISVLSLDLNKEFYEIRKQLDDLVEEFLFLNNKVL
jgi:5-methylcytosine-specific restriction enzyme subunit McrC